MPYKKAAIIATAVALAALLVAYFLFPKPALPPPPTDYRTNDWRVEDLTLMIDGRPMRMGEGSVKYFGNEVGGDFDSDGNGDSAFLFTRDAGGSGTFFYVAVVMHRADGFTTLEPHFLGDRIAPQSTEFSNGKIFVNYADRNPGEPMTAQPSRGVTRVFTVLNGDRLVEAPY